MKWRLQIESNEVVRISAVVQVDALAGFKMTFTLFFKRPYLGKKFSSLAISTRSARPVT